MWIFTFPLVMSTIFFPLCSSVAFLNFKSIEDATEACEKSGRELNGCSMVVTYAAHKDQQHTPFSKM